MRIYKYMLRPTVKLPQNAKILCIQVQHNVPYIWAVVDPSETVLDYYDFQILPTGMDLPELHHNYLGTIQLDGGDLVFHVFTNKGKR